MVNSGTTGAALLKRLQAAARLAQHDQGTVFGQLKHAQRLGEGERRIGRPRLVSLCLNARGVIQPADHQGDLSARAAPKRVGHRRDEGLLIGGDPGPLIVYHSGARVGDPGSTGPFRYIRAHGASMPNAVAVLGESAGTHLPVALATGTHLPVALGSAGSGGRGW